MWQLLVLGSLFAVSIESVIDKFAIITDRRIDYAVATFWRLAFFCVFTLAIGATGVLGPMTIGFSPLVIGVGAMCVASSIFYTYQLRRIEITSLEAFSYLAPFLFLWIDTGVIGTHLSPSEIAGIICMVLGGFAFALDGKTHRIKKELSLKILATLLFSSAYAGVNAYAFKHLHETAGVSSISFVASFGVVAAVGMFLIVLLQEKGRTVWEKPSLVYIPRAAFGKVFDAAGELLWTQALVFAAVSQVSAMSTLEPLVLFITVVLSKQVFRLRTGEKLDRRRLHWKATAVSLLVLGGLLVA